MPPPTSSALELPISLCKGIRSYHNPDPLYACTIHCHHLSPLYFSFISSLNFMSILKSTGEAMTDPRWQLAMLDEMAALHASGTWERVPLPPEKTTIGCRWVYMVKLGPNGNID